MTLKFKQCTSVSAVTHCRLECRSLTSQVQEGADEGEGQ
jgi:hypothetical protein